MASFGFLSSALTQSFEILKFCIFKFSRALLFVFTSEYHLPNVLLKTLSENFTVTTHIPICYLFENKLFGLIVKSFINGQYSEGFF